MSVYPRLLLTTDSGAHLVIDAFEGDPKHVLSQPPQSPGADMAACFTSDGYNIVAGGEDGNIRIWDLDSKRQTPVSSPLSLSRLSTDARPRVTRARLFRPQAARISSRATPAPFTTSANPRSTTSSPPPARIRCSGSPRPTNARLRGAPVPREP